MAKKMAFMTQCGARPGRNIALQRAPNSNPLFCPSGQGQQMQSNDRDSWHRMTLVNSRELPVAIAQAGMRVAKRAIGSLSTGDCAGPRRRQKLRIDPTVQAIVLHPNPIPLAAYSCESSAFGGGPENMSVCRRCRPNVYASTLQKNGLPTRGRGCCLFVKFGRAALGRGLRGAQKRGRNDGNSCRG
jgi:hypothetical protein